MLFVKLTRILCVWTLRSVLNPDNSDEAVRLGLAVPHAKESPPVVAAAPAAAAA